MRVVVYNFVQPEDAKSKQGGGVAVYQGNLVAALAKRGHEVILLSAGDRYSVRTKPAYVVFGRDVYERAVIFNSPVFAPAHFAFHDLAPYTDSDALDPIPAQLRARYGAVDVFHFQNIEGLTAGFLRRLREAFPDAKILYSAHNYNFVCPQVNLWFREYKVCVDYLDGHRCVNCLLTSDRTPYERNIRRLDELIETLGLKKLGRVERVARAGLDGLLHARRLALRPFRRGVPSDSPPVVVTSDAKALVYRRYREANIRLAGEVFDKILSVSERTRQVLIERGVPASAIETSYIGTAHYARSQTATRITGIGPGVHLAYLGYMRADKGFYFFLDALETLSDEVAARLSLTVAAPVHDNGAVPRLRGMSHRFRAITVFDGYTHKTLDAVLAGVNLGVVPVLWEDNLPQVAIEMVSRGIPLLVADRGGASEIADNPAFVFRSGSEDAFRARLGALIEGTVPLGEFWRHEPRLFSMAQHVDDLMRHYEPAAGAREAVPRAVSLPEKALLEAARAPATPCEAGCTGEDAQRAA